MLDLLIRNREIILGKNGQVGQLPRSKRSLLTIFCRKPTAAHRVELERFPSIEAIFFRIQTKTAYGLASDKPIQRKVRVIAGDARCICAGPNRNAGLEHSPNWWCAFGLLRPVSLDKVLTLERHAVLHRDSAAQRFHTFDIAISNRLAVIEEPVQAVKWNLPINLFINVQGSLDRFVVCRM